LQRQYGDESIISTSPDGCPVSQARWFVELKRGFSEGMTKWMVAEGPWDMCVRAFSSADFVVSMHVT
jgi:hypothetical protein